MALRKALRKPPSRNPLRRLRRREHIDDIDRAFDKVERLTAVGSTIGALEQLSTMESMDDHGLMAWPISQTRLRGLNRGVGRYWDRILSYPSFAAVLQTRFLSGLGLLAGGSGRAGRGVFLAGMASTGAAMNARSGYGLDGSDHFAFINYAVSALEKLFPNDKRAREFALSFIAMQSCLSYFTSGAVKLTSPIWRSGDAITGIFRTRTYGDKFFYNTVKGRPLLAKLLAWTVMLSEVTFPIVLFLPKPLARLIFLSGIGFHLGNARFMGLNRFLWSFTATYPAVAHIAQHRESWFTNPDTDRGALGSARRWGLYGALGTWMGLTLFQQADKPHWLQRKLDPTGAAVPNWRFFAPNPGRHDYNLLYRNKLPNGELTGWQEIDLSTDRRLVQMIWHPGRRTEKAIFDVVSELLRSFEDLDDPELIHLTVPYLSLLNYVTHKTEHHADASHVQFLVARSAAHDEDVEVNVLYLSEHHELGGTAITRAAVAEQRGLDEQAAEEAIEEIEPTR